MKRVYILIIVFVLLIGAGFFVNIKFTDKSKNSQNQSILDYFKKPLSVPEKEQNQDKILPSSYKISNVPFQPQAPFANWDQLHDEACEEASIVIAKYYLEGKSLSAEEMDREIINMVNWEIENWGSHKDLTASETVDLARSYYGLNGLEVKKINSINDIKYEIAQNHPIIVPAAGRLLGNPYYRQPGPIYHMLVVTGYNQEIIITNDIGTRRGENYEYSENIFYNAIHDWAGTPANIEEGQKVMIVVKG